MRLIVITSPGSCAAKSSHVEFKTVAEALRSENMAIYTESDDSYWCLVYDPSVTSNDAYRPTYKDDNVKLYGRIVVAGYENGEPCELAFQIERDLRKKMPELWSRLLNR